MSDLHVTLATKPPFLQKRVNTALLKGFILIAPEWCCHAAQLKAAKPAAKHASVAGGAAAPRLPPLPAGCALSDQLLSQI